MRLLLALCLAATARADEEGRAKLLLLKKLTPAEGPYGVGKPINITLQVWNQGRRACVHSVGSVAAGHAAPLVA